ncbi:MAG: YeeE/YedE family protein [Deltaproteobacteria bacterium]|nr:YeeE/YedE family protein [Deltaproteobacteria bacterium]
MEPIAPLSKIFEWGPGTTVIASVLLGVGFGFFLEKAGFGNAKTLAGQWYGYDFAVLRVMFTAIVVAMTGLFGLSALGVVDLAQVYVNETYLWPQIIGGLIFGFGFVVGEYCPGTAIVGCSTGKIDAMIYLGGFFVGLVGFFFAFPLLSSFYESSSLGRVLLPDYFGIPAGFVVFAVVIIALGAFGLTHFIERRLSRNQVAS